MNENQAASWVYMLAVGMRYVTSATSPCVGVICSITDSINQSASKKTKNSNRLKSTNVMSPIGVGGYLVVERKISIDNFIICIILFSETLDFLASA